MLLLFMQMQISNIPKNGSIHCTKIIECFYNRLRHEFIKETFNAMTVDTITAIIMMICPNLHSSLLVKVNVTYIKIDSLTTL